MGLSRAAVGTLLALQVALVLSQVGQRTIEPHAVSVAVQGTPIVAQTVKERLDQAPGEPIRAAVLSRTTDPRLPVRAGDTAATRTWTGCCGRWRPEWPGLSTGT